MQESTRLRLEGSWQEWKGRLQSAWGELTDDDLDTIDGDVEQLVGAIKRKTGESLHDIHVRLDELVAKARR